MKERPIIFSGEMVRAILDGRKTQTRRAVKLNHSGRVQRAGKNWHLDDPDAVMACPYGQPGDRLWVRETFRSRRVDGLPGDVMYRADHPEEKTVPGSYGRSWKPSIHMPRWASRILLEVTAVRVERLQEISEGDAQAEGAFFTDYGRRCHHAGPPRDASECPEPDEHHPQCAGWSMVPTDSHEQCLLCPRMAFANLWDSINGAGSWEANPWVWVVKFRRVAP